MALAVSAASTSPFPAHVQAFPRCAGLMCGPKESDPCPIAARTRPASWPRGGVSPICTPARPLDLEPAGIGPRSEARPPGPMRGGGGLLTRSSFPQRRGGRGRREQPTSPSSVPPVQRGPGARGDAPCLTSSAYSRSAGCSSRAQTSSPSAAQPSRQGSSDARPDGRSGRRGDEHAAHTVMDKVPPLPSVAR
jgi:hypothetical protein